MMNPLCGIKRVTHASGRLDKIDSADLQNEINIFLNMKEWNGGRQLCHNQCSCGQGKSLKVRANEVIMESHEKVIEHCEKEEKCHEKVVEFYANKTSIIILFLIPEFPLCRL